ncbi:MED6-domain-containing protein [Peniophora sp. CONT]|nr:MED6-domain-containing protein [Peniophora sp. CONT]
MDNVDLHPADDTLKFYVWYEWIEANGAVTAENVLQYFSHSQFWDKQSNNEIVGMQTQYSGAGPMSAEARANELKRFTGIEFALVHVTPPSLFIIHKRERLSPDETRPIVAYFVMDNRVYQAPDVYSVISAKLNSSLYALQSTLDKLSSRRPDYTPRTGFAWPITEASEDAKKRRAADRTEESVPPPDATPAESQPEKEKVPGSKDVTKTSNFGLLFNAMATTARHSEKLAQEKAALAAAPPPPSVAPTPAPTLAATPAPSTPAPIDTQQGVAGKKKKKRMSMAAPAP